MVTRPTTFYKNKNEFICSQRFYCDFQKKQALSFSSNNRFLFIMDALCSARNYLNFCKYCLPKTQMYGWHALQTHVLSSLTFNWTKVLNDISLGIKRPNIFRAPSVAKRQSTFGRAGGGKGEKGLRARSTIQNTFTGSVVVRIYVNGNYIYIRKSVSFFVCLTKLAETFERKEGPHICFFQNYLSYKVMLIM